MLINIHRVDDLPAEPQRGHGYAVSTTGDTCELWFVNRSGAIVKQVGQNLDQMLKIQDTEIDVSDGVLPSGIVAGTVLIIGEGGLVGGTFLPSGSMIIALKNDPSTDMVAPDWFTSSPNEIESGSSCYTTTANQSTFVINDLFVANTLVFCYNGYTLNYGTDYVTIDGAEVTYDLDFELEANEHVTITYLKAIPS